MKNEINILYLLLGLLYDYNYKENLYYNIFSHINIFLLLKLIILIYFRYNYTIDDVLTLSLSAFLPRASTYQHLVYLVWECSRLQKVRAKRLTSQDAISLIVRLCYARHRYYFCDPVECDDVNEIVYRLVSGCATQRLDRMVPM